MAPSEGVAVAAREREAETPARLTATLYDLMTALQDVGGPNDALAVTIDHSVTGQMRTHRCIANPANTLFTSVCT
jgi:hypothetical protein